MITTSKSVDLREGQACMAMVVGAWLAEARHDARNRGEQAAAAAVVMQLRTTTKK